MITRRRPRSSRARPIAGRTATEATAVATYEEWQRNALASEPANNGRIASVLFATSDALQWVHVHETWLPADVMAAGPYDF